MASGIQYLLFGIIASFSRSWLRSASLCKCLLEHVAGDAFPLISLGVGDHTFLARFVDMTPAT